MSKQKESGPIRIQVRRFLCSFLQSEIQQGFRPELTSSSKLQRACDECRRESRDFRPASYSVCDVWLTPCYLGPSWGRSGRKVSIGEYGLDPFSQTS